MFIEENSSCILTEFESSAVETLYTFSLKQHLIGGTSMKGNFQNAMDTGEVIFTELSFCNKRDNDHYVELF